MEGEATTPARPLVWHVSDRSSDPKPGSFQSFAEGPIPGSRSSFPPGSVKFFGVRSDLCLSAIGFGYRFYFSDPDHSFFDLHQSTHQMQDGEDSFAHHAEFMEADRIAHRGTANGSPPSYSHRS